MEEFILGNDILKGHVFQRRVPSGCLKAAKILIDEEEMKSFPNLEQSFGS